MLLPSVHDGSLVGDAEYDEASRILGSRLRGCGFCSLARCDGTEAFAHPLKISGLRVYSVLVQPLLLKTWVFVISLLVAASPLS